MSQPEVSIEISTSSRSGGHGGDKEGLISYSESKLAIDVARNKYPYCIVWAPIPILTYEEPFPFLLSYVFLSP